MSKEINELKSHLDTMVGNSSQMKAEKLVKLGYRKQSEGEWVIKTGGYYQRLVCTACGGIGTTTTKFCPNCGAKMYNKTLDRAKMKGERQ